MKFKILIFSLFCFLTVKLMAQKINNSPYSRYGIGDLHPLGYAQNVAIGGGGIAMRDPFVFNLQNPASLASLELTTFDAGFHSRWNFFQSSGSKMVSNNTNIHHLSIAFPVTKWWGTGVGLKPYSSVGYDLKDSTVVQNFGTVDLNYLGDGGINQVFLANGIKPLRNLFIGLNTSWLFGNIVHAGRIYYPASSNGYNSRWTDRKRFTGLHLLGGAQYTYQMDEKNSFTLGINFSHAQQLESEGSLLTERFTMSIDSIEIPKDTTFYKTDLKSTVNLPQTMGFGLRWARDERWVYYSDLSIQNWSDFKYHGKRDSLANSFTFSLGAQLQPDKNSTNNFFDQIRYRIGARYSKTPVKLRNSQLSEGAVTLGMGFPLRKSFSTVNLALEAGIRGTTKNDLIRENFLNLVIALTLNDKWFIKSKIE